MKFYTISTVVHHIYMNERPFLNAMPALTRAAREP